MSWRTCSAMSLGTAWPVFRRNPLGHVRALVCHALRAS